MPSVKTAISLEAPLLRRIDATAAELDLPRSRLLSLAADEFITRHENAKLLEDLNRAHADGPTPEEIELRRAARRKHARRIEGDW